MSKARIRTATVTALLVSVQPLFAQDKPVYRCPGPPVIYTDAITASEAAARLCRAIEADRWLEVGRNESSIVYVDTETVSRSGRVVRAWLKRVHARPVNSPTDRLKNFLSTKELSLFNCEERSVANLQLLRFANAEGSGSPVETTANTDSAARFKPLIPESFDERVLANVCNALRK